MYFADNQKCLGLDLFLLISSLHPHFSFLSISSYTPLYPLFHWGSRWVCNRLVTVCQSASEPTICPLGFRLGLCVCAHTRTCAPTHTHSANIPTLTVEPSSFTPQYDDSCITHLLTWAVRRAVTNITHYDISHTPRWWLHWTDIVMGYKCSDTFFKSKRRVSVYFP